MALPVVTIRWAALILIAVGFLAAPGAVNAAVYWSGGGIGRASLDGLVREPKFIEGLGGPCGIEVSGDHIYWANAYDFTIGRASIDGRFTQRDFITVPQGATPCDVAVDSMHVYWSTAVGTIGRADLDGSNPDQVFAPLAGRSCAIAVNATHMYWTDNEDGKIYRSNIDGSGSAEVIVSGLMEPCGIEINGEQLFWADESLDAIGRVNLDGGEAQVNFIAGADNPSALSVHAGYVYWVNAGFATQSVGRADLSGQNVDQRFIGDLNFPWGVAVDSVPVTLPAPPLVIPQVAVLRIGKARRNRRTGAIVIPVDLARAGYFHAEAIGVRITFSEGADNGFVSAGRKWLRVTPIMKGPGVNRCIRRALSRGERVKLDLKIRFGESDQIQARWSRGFWLFKQPSRTRTKPRHGFVSCESGFHRQGPNLN